MKRIIPLVLLSICFSYFAYGQPAIVLPENANLRGTPKVTGTVVQTLPHDAKVQIIKKDGPWFLVHSEEFVGWIHGNTIRIMTGSLTNRPIVLQSTKSITYVPPTYRPTQRVTAPSTAPMPLRSKNEEQISPSGVETSPPVIVPALISTENTVETSEMAPKTTDTPPTATLAVTGICEDGSTTTNVIKQGACSGHGGVANWYAESGTTTRSSPASTSSPSKVVQVKGYTRSDGTYVAPHTRSVPRRKP